jgi:RNA polymerase sigma factor (sigma-70 family)
MKLKSALHSFMMRTLCAGVIHCLKESIMTSEDIDVTSEHIDTKCRHLLAEWRNGNNEARERLAELNMDLVRKFTSSYHKKTGLNPDDLSSAAHTALFNALNGLFNCSHDNVRAYVTTAIKNALQDEKDRQFQHNQCHEQLDPSIHEGSDPKALVAKNELLNEILDLCEDLRDRAIVMGRLQGRELAEIAKSVNRPKSTVSYRLSKIERRFYTLNPNRTWSLRSEVLAQRG